MTEPEVEDLLISDIGNGLVNSQKVETTDSYEARFSHDVESQLGAAVAARTCRSVVTQSRVEKTNGFKSQPQMDSDLSSIVKEYDRLVRRLKLPPVSQQDGRYPVYVIFSVRSHLEAVYGGRIADLLVSEMQALAETVAARKGWSARLFLPDDAALLSPLGLSPLRTIDPWELKLALVDLDSALYRSGERIGAVLIVGLCMEVLQEQSQVTQTRLLRPTTA